MSRAIDRPEPCLRQLKQAKGGVWVPSRIHRTCHCTINGYPEDNSPHPWRDTCDRYPRLEAEINGRPADVDRVWTSGRRVTMAEYLFLKADRAWAREHAPQSPEANPWRPIDLNTLAPPNF